LVIAQGCSDTRLNLAGVCRCW